MPVPVVQVMMGGGGAGLLPMTKALTDFKVVVANQSPAFNIGAAQDDRWVIAAVGVSGLAGNFSALNINGVAATLIIASGIVNNMRSLVYRALVPLGTTCTIQPVGRDAHIYAYRVTGMKDTGPDSSFGSWASYVFPGGNPQPMQCQTGPFTCPKNSCSIMVATDSSGVASPAMSFGGAAIEAQATVSTGAGSRLDAAAAASVTFSFFHQAAGAVVFAVANVAGPP